MLPLEKQVCALQYAERLRELGVKQDSYFNYYKDNENEIHIFSKTENGSYNEYVGCTYVIFSAFTVAELGEMLPKEINIKTKKGKSISSFQINARGGYWQAVYFGAIQTAADTEADARSQMLIHLIENGLVKVEDINK